MTAAYAMRRGLFTLAGLAGAAACVWAATLFDRHTTAGYWYSVAILIGAGMAIALSQLLGGWTKDGMPHISPTVFTVAFVPALIVVGWVLVAGQPHGNTARSHIRTWSRDLNVNGVVNDWRQLLPAIAMLLGLAFALCLDTTGRRRAEVVEERTFEPAAADEPLARERIATGATTPAPAATNDPDAAAVTRIERAGERDRIAR